MSSASIPKIILCSLLIIISGCMPVLSSESLAESDHPYQNNYENIWTIKEPGAAQIRLHFEYLKLAKDENGGARDRLILLDQYGNKLITYQDHDGISDQDFWTEWYEGDTLQVELVTDSSRICDGFIIDKGEIRSNGTSSSSEILGNSKYTVSEVQSDDTKTEGNKNSTVQSDITETDVNKVLTITELASSANPSVFGQSLTLVAKVNIPSEETEEPLGTVTFIDGTTPIGTADLISGQATLTTSSLSVGSHSITAVYNGDNNFKLSTSSPLVLTVQEQPSSEEPSSTDEQASKENPNTKPSPTSKELIWENPYFCSLVITIVGGVIVNNVPSLKDKVNVKGKVKSVVSMFRK